MCVHVHVGMCACMHVMRASCVHGGGKAWRPEGHLRVIHSSGTTHRSFLFVCLSLFFNSLSLDWSSVSRLGWLASKSWGDFACFCFINAEVATTCLTSGKHISDWLNHLPSSNIHIYNKCSPPGFLSYIFTVKINPRLGAGWGEVFCFTSMLGKGWWMKVWWSDLMHILTPLPQSNWAD